MDREQIKLNRVESQFPTKLRTLRHEKGLSRRELAVKLRTDSLSFSVSSIAAYENGRAWPNLNRCLRLCEFFDVTLEYLFKGGIREKFGVISEDSNDDECPISSSLVSYPILRKLIQAPLSTLL